MWYVIIAIVIFVIYKFITAVAEAMVRCEFKPCVAHGS